MAKQATEQQELIPISRRERRLRERLLAVEEDLIYDEKHIRAKRDNRKAKLTKKINQARRQQEGRLDRRDSSKLYQKSRILYYLTRPFAAIGRWFGSLYRKLTGRVKHHQAVTPHRSFYLTTHAQAVRQINISGYGRFMREVWRMIWDNRRLYLKVLVILTLALLTVIGLGAQSSYIEMRDALQDVGLGSFLEWVGMMTQAIITSLTVADANKQMLFTMIVIVAWLALIYIARHVYGNRGNGLKMRDVLYNCCGPLMSLAAMLVILLIQLLPLALVLISYAAITGAGYINQGIEIENMAAWCAIAAVAILTLYWMITSMLCLITVTIPGIYPLRAYFETSVQVSGRRVKILLRVLTMFVPVVIAWLLILGPVVALDAVWKPTTFPFVQVVTTALVAATIIWISAYLYMLYRRILDSPEQPIGTRNINFTWPWRRRKLTATASSSPTAKHADKATG